MDAAYEGGFAGRKWTPPMLRGVQKAVMRGEASQLDAPDAFARAGIREIPTGALGTEVQRFSAAGAREYSLMVPKGMVRPLGVGSSISLEDAHINRTWGGRTRRWLFE